MASGFLSYQDTRGEVDYLGKVINAVKKYLDNREKKEKVADVVAAKVNVLNDQKTLPGSSLQKMLSGSSLQRSLPGGPMAINPDVIDNNTSEIFPKKRLTSEGFVGNSIVDISATSLGVERDSSNSDMFVKRLNAVDDGVGGGSGEVVQAIDRLTFVTMSLVAATKEQTQQQKLIASTQQQQAEKLARQAKAASEESALEMGADLSGNTPYQRLLSGATNAMGGSRGGGGPGMGIGGKAMTKALLGSATKRGAARTGTRLGAALGGKMMGGLGKRVGAKLGAKSAGKIAGGAIAKSLGKKIPLVGLGLGAVFAAQRAMQGDFLGAGLELASGAASTVPGIGTAGSIGIDAALAARDMTMMADGGIVDSPTNAIIGEKGREGVFPLEGSKGKKTFLQFGEGILEAQKKNKKEFAKLQAEGMAQYYEKQNGWEKWWTGFKEFLSELPLIGRFFKDNDETPNNPPNSSTGNTPKAKVGNNLFSTISGGEGGINSYNTGTAGSQAGYTPPKPISQMTVGEIMDSQSSGSLFAVGKYQITPVTMKGFVKQMGIGRGDVFNEETQDKFREYTVNFKRPNVGKFLKGVEGSSLEKAQLALAAEFASVGVPRDMKKGEYGGGYPVMDIKRGESLYKGIGGNAASIGPDVIAEALQKEKDQFNKPPESDISDSAESDRRQTDASQGISRNFGKKSGESIHFVHNGEKYHAVKTTNGWDLYKGAGGMFGGTRLSTSEGKNSGVIDSFIQQAETESISPLGDTSSTAVNAKSTEIAMASSVGGAGTTIINNITNMNGGSSNGGNASTNVPFGIALVETGTSSFSNMDLRTIG